jgi:hypothetical protein
MRGSVHYLFICNPDQIVSAKLDAVFRHRGHVDDVPYSEWQDDGNGGVADRRPLKGECILGYQKWLKELKEER